MFIAFAGLPCSGKSTTAKALATCLQGVSFVEPEECDWPPLVATRELTGHFTALTWFRTARVPNLFLADEVRRNGGIAVVDSYYDVLVSQYLGMPAFDWLLPKQDPYYPAALEMAKTDWLALPKANILVFLHINKAVWLKFMTAREREFDASADLAKHFEMQDHIERACICTAEEHGTKLLKIEQAMSSPDETAQKVAQIITENYR